MIPSRRRRRLAVAYDAVLYRQRHRIENAFGRLKDWRRIALRADRCADLFLSLCVLPTVVVSCL